MSFHNLSIHTSEACKIALVGEVDLYEYTRFMVSGCHFHRMGDKTVTNISARTVRHSSVMEDIR